MNTLLDESTSRTRTNLSPSERLRSEMIALRLSFTWFGTRKSLSPAQKTVAAESFGAAGDYITAGKKLINTQHPKFKAVSTIKSRAVSYFKGMSLPYPEPGLRLIKQADLGAMTLQLTTLKQDLDYAVNELDDHYDELKAVARQRLGDLYNAADYPASLDGLFDMTWDFPSVEPPDYLRRLSPELYAQECRRVQARFDEAVQLAEAAFTEELARLVEHLSERLSGQIDGKPKVFRDSMITNLTEFFERFGNLNVRSNEQLDQLVERAQQVVRGVEPQQLRDSQSLRQQVAAQLSGVQSALDGLLVDRPRRRIIRSPK